ncbi:PWWP domain-containing DNA repair factor 3A [Indicator indicator]|uniref:PWWP domain-containing DNA repair factor 3A n=1 Tax=Indicator indicator TaxID=1002788 RepID=UPI0023DF57DE|nr:PWWP domain-containing DNA repair factor 3A [Indicator indicator]
MTDQEYVLCTWKKRLWPAKVLCKSGLAGQRSISDGTETSFEVEILGLKEQVSVSCANTVPLKEESIESIASSLDERKESSEAVEELKYRRSLKIALDVLTQNGLARQMSPSEGPNALLSQENKAGPLPTTCLCSCQVLFKDMPEPETSRKKKEQRNDFSLKTETKKPTQKVSFRLEESRTKPSRCSTGDLSSTAKTESQNGIIPKAKSLPREKAKARLLSKSSPRNKTSCRPKEERRKQGGRQPRAAGSAVLCGGDSPQDQAQPFAEEGPSVRRVNTRSQPKRTLLNLCPSASDDLEKSINSESENLVKQLDGRKKPESLKRMNGEQEMGAAASSSRKRRCRIYPQPSSGPPPQETLLERFPSQPEEKGNKNSSPEVTSKIKHFQLPDFEEDEGMELSELSSKIPSSESLTHLSALLDEEEEEDEELPCVLSRQEPQAIEEGILVWCKLRGYPYWPAVVKNVKRKHRKAYVLLIDGTTNERKKGFSVPLKNLKHFDCEEKQDLIERAKEGYRQEIEWCVRLIADYRIRVGCHSFTGSFLEYFAADISYPVRKEGYQDVLQMTFPNETEENGEESPSEASPSKPPKKLLPDRSRAARDRANQKIVEFIVKTKGAEEHLLAILKSRKQSRWLKEFLNSGQYVTCVETYLEDEEQLDLVVNYLKEVYHGIDAKNLHQLGGDGIKLISDVLLPEAIIYAISAVDDIDYKKAEEKYIKGPSVSKREREIFEEEILERKRQSELVAADRI